MKELSRETKDRLWATPDAELLKLPLSNQEIINKIIYNKISYLNFSLNGYYDLSVDETIEWKNTVGKDLYNAVELIYAQTLSDRKITSKFNSIIGLKNDNYWFLGYVNYFNISTVQQTVDEFIDFKIAKHVPKLIGTYLFPVLLTTKFFCSYHKYTIAGIKEAIYIDALNELNA